MSLPTLIAAKRSGDRVTLTVQHFDGTFHQMRLKVSAAAMAVSYNPLKGHMWFQRTDRTGKNGLQFDFALQVHRHLCTAIFEIFCDDLNWFGESRVEVLTLQEAAD